MSWDRLSSRYGTAGEHGAYGNAIDLYYEDRVEEAYESVSSLGTGQGAHGLTWFRLMEAEALTREMAERAPVNEWLTLEMIPDELGPLARDLPGVLLEEAEAVSARLGFGDRPPVLVTVLAEEVDAPWTPNRQGFCVDMVPYSKIVLPRRAMLDSRELREAMRHEYAHVATHHMTLGRCPRWLDEAIAMTMGGGADPEDARDFASGDLEWLAPDELNLSFLEDRETRDGREEVWLAYQQSAWIGRYLLTLQGDEGLARLLRAFSNNSRWQDLKLLVTGQPPENEALTEAFGMRTEDLFDRALQWLEERF